VRSGNGGVTAIRPRGEPAHYSDEAKKGEGAGVTKIGFFAGEGKSGGPRRRFESRRPQEPELYCSKLERDGELMIAVDVTTTQLRWTRRSKEPN
jgi:hypothetical protein